MFRGHVGMPSFTMLNRFVQVCDRFLQMRVSASSLSMISRLFRMRHKCVSMALFAMVDRLLRMCNGVSDVTGW